MSSDREALQDGVGVANVTRSRHEKRCRIYHKYYWVLKLKILHINSYFANGHFYRHLYDEQVKQGQNISVFLPVSRQTSIEYTYPEYVDLVRCYNERDRYLFFPKHWKMIKEAINRYQNKDFDIIHAHSLFSNGYIAFKFAKKTGVPYVVAVRNTDVNVFFKKLFFLRFLGKRILLNANKVVFISHPYREQVIKTYFSASEQESIRQKSVVIPNGIDSFWFDNPPLGHRSQIDEKLIKIITVGEISKNKNHLVVCKAVELLQQEGFTCSYTVIGKVVDKELFDQIMKYPFVVYKSFMPKEQLIEEYRNADVFVLPSKTETFGLVYAEAMSQGLPVIYTKGQGFDGQFEEGEVGYHVEACNSKEIANCIMKIIMEYDPTAYGNPRDVHKFCWYTIMEQYQNIYQSII